MWTPPEDGCSEDSDPPSVPVDSDSAVAVGSPAPSPSVGSEELWSASSTRGEEAGVGGEGGEAGLSDEIE